MYPLHTFNHDARNFESPWSLTTRLKIQLWLICWRMFCRWTPKPLNRWRLLILRLFGARIHGRPFVHQRANIYIPWHVTLHHRAALGDETYVYSLGEIEIMEEATIGPQVYLCTGTHDLKDPRRPLQVGKIRIGRRAFVGARAFIMPGVEIGDDAAVGACSVVTGDVPPGAVVVGNPARLTRLVATVNRKDAS